MRLKRLWIDGFKNLHNFEIDFSDKNGITILVGNNGSGKSNVLEAISAIFSNLYNIQNSQRKKIDFKYEIEYEMLDKHVVFSFNEDYTLENYNAAGRKKRIDKFSLNEYLPSNVLMIYSGEDAKILKQFYEPFTRKFQKDIREAQIIPSLPKMLYLNSFFWTISLLSLLSNDNNDFCKRILKNNSLEDIKISFIFNQTLIQNQISFLNQLSNNEEEKTFTLEEFKAQSYLPIEKDLFVQLTGMVGLKNKIKKLVIYNQGIDTIYLSEGEKKQLLIKSALEILADENSLILMDEPDANIHIANKIQIKTILTNYENRENILTTHSPTLTHHFDDKHIVMLNDGKVEDKTKQEIFSHITDGIWNYQEQSIFLSSRKDIILLVEGKHDKIHIEEAFKRLKDNYDGLDFDIFFADGANNLKQLVLGFSTSDFDLDSKKIIAIFDDDDDGRKGRGQQNFKKVNNDEKINCLKSNESFYGILLPKQDSFSGEFTIENMYSPLKFKEAMQYAFTNRQTQDDFFNAGINDISKKIKEDAKNKLADSCKDFNDEDFEHFKKLFDLIKTIKGL